MRAKQGDAVPDRNEKGHGVGQQVRFGTRDQQAERMRLDQRPQDRFVLFNKLRR
jgi:hypothetical protein